MTDINELERLAKAADATWAASNAEFQIADGSRWFSVPGNHPDADLADLDPEDAAYIVAASPENVLALIARVREMEGAMEEIAVARGWVREDWRKLVPA